MSEMRHAGNDKTLEAKYRFVLKHFNCYFFREMVKEHVETFGDMIKKCSYEAKDYADDFDEFGPDAILEVFSDWCKLQDKQEDEDGED